MTENVTNTAQSQAGIATIENGGYARYGDRIYEVTDYDGEPQLSVLTYDGNEVTDFEDEGGGVLSLDLANGEVVVVTRKDLRDDT